LSKFHGIYLAKNFWEGATFLFTQYIISHTKHTLTCVCWTNATFIWISMDACAKPTVDVA